MPFAVATQGARQPWLGTGTRVADDDFSPASATIPLGKALGALALAMLVLAMGRAPQIASAAYDLPILPGTEALIAAAEAWETAMQWMGL
ncbi:MAG: hypothetical protein V4653_03020 [Pseudomonadota bacterium]